MGDMSSSWLQRFTPEDAESSVRMHERRMCPVGMSFPKYLDALQSSGQAQCTTVWTKGTVAYRCRKCQVNDSSAICVGCFQKGEHKEHDYVMYHSESGGCCDCGDPDAWQEEGFCSAHRSVDRQEPSVPPELEGPTKVSVGTVLGVLSFIIGYVSVTKGGPLVSEKTKIETAMVFLDWLKKLCSVDALRKIVCSEVVQMTAIDRETRELKTPLQILLRTFANMPEVIMEGETTLFLQMLYNPNFKNQYSEELINHYPAMIESVVDRNFRVSYEPSIKRFKALDSSLERVMVQIFNVANMKLIKDKDLLKLFVMSFGKILRRCVSSGTNVVNVKDPRIVNKMYLRPQGDLRLIVAHQPVAQVLLEEQTDVFTSILDVLVLLQWMNPYSSTRSVDFEEQNEWTLAIQLEMNTMAIVFQIFSKCFAISSPELEDPMETSRKTLLSAASRTLVQLQQYLMKEPILNFLGDTSANTSMSLHIPLHRTLSAILAKLVLLPWNDAKNGFLSSLNFGYSENEVLALMEHPLRIMVWMAQIRAGRWVVASEDFSRLELIYRGSFWHDQSMDMDILLLQFCAVARENMERAVFMRMAERFELKELVSSPEIDHDKLVRDKISLLQDFIRLVLLVVRERRNTGMKEGDCLRYDVIQWLCVKNQTYSQLCRALSAIPVNHQKLTEMLDIVALFHNPKVQERGYYELKAECWQEFDPLFAHFYSNELVDAQERAVHVGKLPHYWRIKPCGVVKEPYNRLINLLHTEECHQLLWNVLNYVSALVMNDSTATACESLGVTALQMMGLALQDRRDYPERFPASSEGLQLPLVSSNDIFYNVHRRPQFNKSTRVMEWGIYQSESPSILDLLRKLQDVTNAPRLVDSVHYVMHLLMASPYTVTSGGSSTDIELVLSPKLHARVHTTDDDDRLQKKQRQEAIMAQFKAKQNAFLEHFEDSDDDESGTTSNLDSNLRAAYGAEDPSSEVSSVVAGSKKTSVEPVEAHECALCRSECGGNDKSTGWIGFVQRYSMPNLVIEKKMEVTDKGSAETIVKMASMPQSAESSRDAKQLLVYTGKKMIDHVPAEHVRCCGHQMHQECFQSYHSSLLKSHCNQAPYEGKGIIEIDKVEFLCPICRRLANALLPVVPQASLSRMVQACVTDDLENQGQYWEKFWEKCKSLPGALDRFASQSLRVRSNWYEEAKELPMCPVLWEVFASNITHCEVETREELQEVSTASHQPSNQRIWGSDTGHWIAIQELGKLAMVSNTLDQGQEMAIKKEKIKNMLAKIMQFMKNRELSTQNKILRNLFTSVHDALVRLQNSVKETHQLEVVKSNKGKEEDTCHKLGVLQRPFSSGYHPPIPGYSDFNAQQQRDPAPWTSFEPPMPQYWNARGMPPGMAPGAEDQEMMTPGKNMTGKGTDYAPAQNSFGTESLTPLESAQFDLEGSSTLQNCRDPAPWTNFEPPMPQYWNARGMPPGMAPGAEDQEMMTPGKNMTGKGTDYALAQTSSGTESLTPLESAQIDSEWSSTLQNCRDPAPWTSFEPPMPQYWDARGMPPGMAPGAEDLEMMTPGKNMTGKGTDYALAQTSSGTESLTPLESAQFDSEWSSTLQNCRDPAPWTSFEPPMPQYWDARGMPPGMAPGAEDQEMMTPGKNMGVKGRDYAPAQTSFGTESLTPLESAQIDSEWSSTLQNCRDPAPWTSFEPPMPQYWDARGMPPGMAPGAEDQEMMRPGKNMAMEGRGYAPAQSSSGTESLTPLESAQFDLEWSSTLQNCSLFDADPFGLLIVLLSAFPGWPKAEEILLLVKFAYAVALTQVLLACSGLQSNVDMDVRNLERDWGAVVRYACLPFLRRAALLVQIITGEGCKQKYSGSGRRVMDASYLQQELGLEDSYRSFMNSGFDGAEASNINYLLQKLRLDYNLLSKDSKHTLMEVPKELHFAPLPLVYQELLLQSITDTGKCQECNTTSSEPAICLVCGFFYCCGTPSCAECSRHARSEGSGIGVYLLMHSTQLVLIRGNRVCMAPSLYLDQHGEGAFGERQDESDSDESDEPEDTFLRRSQLLHLSYLRLNEVRRMWVTAAFDYDTHILHNSKISAGVL